MDADRKALKARHLAVCEGVAAVLLCGERCLCGGRAAAEELLVQRLITGNGSALYEKTLGRCSSRLTWCFVLDGFTCSRAFGLVVLGCLAGLVLGG